MEAFHFGVSGSLITYLTDEIQGGAVLDPNPSVSHHRHTLTPHCTALDPCNLEVKQRTSGSHSLRLRQPETVFINSPLLPAVLHNNTACKRDSCKKSLDSQSPVASRASALIPANRKTTSAASALGMRS